MRNRLFYFFAITCLLVLTACETNSKAKGVELPNLSGLWKFENQNGIFEQWWLVNDSVLSGKSFSIGESDTILYEKLRMATFQNKLYYFAQVMDQNMQNEIAFQMVRFDKNEWVFENKLHDYPNRIIYKLLSDSTLYVRVEDDKGIKFTTFNFIKQNQ